MKIEAANRHLMGAIDEEIEKYKNGEETFKSVQMHIDLAINALRTRLKEIEDIASERGDLPF